MDLHIPYPNPKQIEFFKARKKFIGYGGARGGGKSWALRTKFKLLALKYTGIKLCIVRRTYPELQNNHISILRPELVGVATYNDRDKEFTFINGSKLKFMYCSNDGDLTNFQGNEWDIIGIDEATNLTEFQIKQIIACVRGANDFPKRIYMTCNPGGVGHSYIKRIFIDKEYIEGEYPEDYEFIQAKVDDNMALMKMQPEYKKQLEALPPKLRKAWLEGSWDIFEGVFFEEFRNLPEHYEDRQWTHVIEPFEPPSYWNIYRSYDFGYNKPASCGYWAVDTEGIVYRILEVYFWNGQANEGAKMTPDEQFKELRELENTHPWLKGKKIFGVADPACWNNSMGDSVADTASKYGIYFTPGDNARIDGWMQFHYRMQFDENGYPRMYIFKNCKALIRTMPLMMYSDRKPEDLNTELEDHAVDETRYFLMLHKIKARVPVEKKKIFDDPLNMNVGSYRIKSRSFAR